MEVLLFAIIVFCEYFPVVIWLTVSREFGDRLKSQFVGTIFGCTFICGFMIATQLCKHFRFSQRDGMLRKLYFMPVVDVLRFCCSCKSSWKFWFSLTFAVMVHPLRLQFREVSEHGRVETGATSQFNRSVEATFRDDRIFDDMLGENLRHDRVWRQFAESGVFP